MRIVLHMDMDAFFASVEERDKPRLRGLPIVVGADPVGGRGRGVVSTANYAARKYGIKSAMPISKAWELSQQAKKAGKPEAVFMGGSFSQYAKVSREIFAYVATMGSAFEQTSVDEGYLELLVDNSLETPVLEPAGSVRGFAATSNPWQYAKWVAARIQDHIQEKFQLSCSIGVGPNKLIAKIAAGMKKPHGLTVVRDSEVQEFLDPLSVRELPGIGPKAGEQLRRLGINTIAELRTKDKEQLIEWFGKHGEGMYQRAQGIDDSPVESGGEAKSVGRHWTFDVDTLDGSVMMQILKDMAKEISEEVAREKKWFRTVTFTARFSNFKTHTRSHTIAPPAQDAKTLETEGMKLLLPFLDSRENPKRLKLRLIGLRAEKFAQEPTPVNKKEARQQGLF